MSERQARIIQDSFDAQYRQLEEIDDLRTRLDKLYEALDCILTDYESEYRNNLARDFAQQRHDEERAHREREAGNE